MGRNRAELVWRFPEGPPHGKRRDLENVAGNLSGKLRLWGGLL
jgi:hypothetical protein